MPWGAPIAFRFYLGRTRRNERVAAIRSGLRRGRRGQGMRPQAEVGQMIFDSLASGQANYFVDIDRDDPQMRKSARKHLSGETLGVSDCDRHLLPHGEGANVPRDQPVGVPVEAGFDLLSSHACSLGQFAHLSKGAVTHFAELVTRRQLGLTPLAGAALALLTVCAAVYQVIAGQPANGVFAIVVGLFAAFVAYGRLRLAPLHGAPSSM